MVVNSGDFYERMPVCVVRLFQGRVGSWISNTARGYYVSTGIKMFWIADIWNGMNRFSELDHLEESPNYYLLQSTVIVK